MSLFGRRQKRDFYGISGAGDLIAQRAPQRSGAVVVNDDTAMRNSAVWACVRLRNDLISTMPVDVYRIVNGVQVETPKPPIFVEPGGERVDWCEWAYSSGSDLDRSGNTIGLITEVNALGLPSRIDLQLLSECQVLRVKGELQYRIAGKLYRGDAIKTIWHEKQYTVAGLDVGLSAIAHAAWSIGEYLSIQHFALDWFAGGAVPKGRLRNTAKTVNATDAALVKDRYRASVANGDIFVTGMDWEFDFIQAQTQDKAWIEAKQYGVGDIARFFGCPGDLIDAAVSSGSITYANITQRNLQFLIMNLGPAIIRRERTWSRRLVPRPRFVKLNTDALLRMDPKARAEMLQLQINSRQRTPDEARGYDNLPPLTEEDYAQFERLFGAKKPPATAARELAQYQPEIYHGQPIRVPNLSPDAIDWKPADGSDHV